MVITIPGICVAVPFDPTKDGNGDSVRLDGGGLVLTRVDNPRFKGVDVLRIGPDELESNGIEKNSLLAWFANLVDRHQADPEGMRNNHCKYSPQPPTSAVKEIVGAVAGAPTTAGGTDLKTSPDCDGNHVVVITDSDAASDQYDLIIANTWYMPVDGDVYQKLQNALHCVGRHPDRTANGRVQVLLKPVTLYNNYLLIEVKQRDAIKRGYICVDIEDDDVWVLSALIQKSIGAIILDDLVFWPRKINKEARVFLSRLLTTAYRFKENNLFLACEVSPQLWSSWLGNVVGFINGAESGEKDMAQPHDRTFGVHLHLFPGHAWLGNSNNPIKTKLSGPPIKPKAFFDAVDVFFNDHVKSAPLK